MCGLSGFLSFRGRAPEPGRILPMNRLLAHRGPDGEGYFFFGESAYLASAPPLPAQKRSAPISGALGHRRLSIIDLSEAAAQPMHLEDGSVSLVFNGEIYNHADLRGELQALGHRFFTHHSDTEVIIRAYRQWGIEALHKFRGMFAIALIDFVARKAYLVRDRIGVKPLYYSWSGGTIFFASEIKAIVRGLGSVPAARPQSVYDYMTFLTVPAPHTMFEGIQKLEAGHWLELNFDGSSRIREYWDPLDNSRKMEGRPLEEWTEDILAGLRTSVKLRMEADVPVGVFLSGGIDSSINSVLFSELARERVKTFTIGYSDSLTHQNEFAPARQVANQIGSDHHEMRIEQRDLLDFLPKMVFHQDEPLADPVCIPLYFIAKLARENGVTVCQVGEGSDELFIGYTDWITKYRLQKWAGLPLPRGAKRLAYSALENLGLSTSTAREFLRRDSVGLPVFWSGAEAFTEAEKLRLFSPAFRREHQVVSPDSWIRALYQKYSLRSPGSSICDWMSYADLKLRLPELLLMRVDKMTMACGLEARVPFLDHKFVQASFSIPEHMKIQGLECKALLKKAVEPLLPREIVYRPKQGFSVPVKEWLSDALGGEVEKEIRQLQKETGWFQDEELGHFLRTKHRGIWNLFNLALWHRLNSEYLRDP